MKLQAFYGAYRTTYKRKLGYTPFKKVYGQKVVFPLPFKQFTLAFAQVLHLDVVQDTQDRLFDLQNLEEQRNIIRISQTTIKIMA